ncbi:hypothetical protein ACIQBJ_18450 [Kitasatospora sp. NPDC088391]|uniref:hypothetical protein n=1 Tax=Kitasatospora sp. NPDC088391 TaxID=3364074 RepID=UPI00380734F8
MFEHQYPGPTAKLTIRIYTVRADGTRVTVSSCTSDEPIMPPPVSALTWPACRCPRCATTTGAGNGNTDTDGDRDAA